MAISKKTKDLIESTLTKANNKVNDLFERIDYMLEHVDNIVPEVPDESKTSGKDIEKELEGDPVKGSEGKTLEEHEDNFMPEVPDESNRAAAAIKKAIEADNPKIDTNIKNELKGEDPVDVNPTHTVPQPVATTVKTINKALTESEDQKKLS